jgi:hypothetical protein
LSELLVKLTFESQSEIERIARECAETAARRDSLAHSIRDKEQVGALSCRMFAAEKPIAA